MAIIDGPPGMSEIEGRAHGRAAVAFLNQEPALPGWLAQSLVGVPRELAIKIEMGWRVASALVEEIK